MVMRSFLQKIHGLPEDARKFFAGICMLAAGIAFFGVWTSFVSSRLVALAPSPAPALTAQDAGGASAISDLPVRSTQTGLPAPAPAMEALSPAAGIADTLRGFQSVISGSAGSLGGQQAGQAKPAQGFFASVGEKSRVISAGIWQMWERIAEYIYRTVSRYVPPYL